MSANPKSQASLSIEKKLNRKVQGSSTSPAAHRQDYDEFLRRLEDPVNEPAASVPRFIATPTSNPSTPVTPPALIAPDRWHKYSDFYITVSPIHIVTSDPVPDDSAFHTITDAINFAATYYTALALIYIDPIIEIEVHGGQYTENVTVNVDYLRFQGIGFPTIIGTVTVDTLCTRIIFNEFVIEDFFDINAPPNDSIVINPGTESGRDISDVQFRNCIIRGNIVARIKRWSYFENCDFQLQGKTSLAAVNVSFSFTPNLMTKWIIFFNCRFRAYNDQSDYRDRKKAVAISAIDGAGVWYPNGVTYGSGLYSLTGVLLHKCVIDGFTENYGWCLEYRDSYGIEGYFINGTAGSVHHLIYCNSDAVVDAFTWFNHSDGAVRYLVQTNEFGATVGASFCNVWLSHVEHTLPDGGVQSPQAVIAASTGGVNTNTHVYGSFSNTHAQYFFQNPVATEGAKLLLTPGGGATCSADLAGLQQIFYQQGYVNW